jgi:DNA-binding response OmpR family regulator
MKKIVFIQNEISAPDIYKTKLESMGYKIIKLSINQDDLSELKQSKPDLIILDVTLPAEINCFNIIQKKNIDDELANIPVIVIANIDSEEKTAYDIGVKEYIIKARISQEDLVAKIRNYIEN